MPKRTAVILEGQSDKGVGEAVTRLLARDNYKCLCGIEEDQLSALRKKEDPDIKDNIEQTAISLDDRSSIITGVGEIVAQYGSIELLAINANQQMTSPLSAVEPDDWSRVLEQNLLGPFYTIQEFAPHMKGGRNRRIILILPGRNENETDGSNVLTNASNGALQQLVHTLSQDLHPDVTVNAVLPGNVVEKSDGQKVRTREKANNPSQRQLQPDDVAEAVHYLSRRTNKVTGQVISLDSNTSFL